MAHNSKKIDELLFALDAEIRRISKDIEAAKLNIKTLSDHIIDLEIEKMRVVHKYQTKIRKARRDEEKENI